MEVYIFRGKECSRIYVSLSKPIKLATGEFRYTKILFKFFMASFRKKFGFTIRPGKCVKSELFLDEYGEEV